MMHCSKKCVIKCYSIIGYYTELVKIVFIYRFWQRKIKWPIKCSNTIVIIELFDKKIVHQVKDIVEWLVISYVTMTRKLLCPVISNAKYWIPLPVKLWGSVKYYTQTVWNHNVLLTLLKIYSLVYSQYYKTTPIKCANIKILTIYFVYELYKM